jgi:hypothetical protein
VHGIGLDVLDPRFAGSVQRQGAPCEHAASIRW